jgi:galactose-1-phosphate uridylyltransferase
MDKKKVGYSYFNTFNNRYCNLFTVLFAYSARFHQPPADKMNIRDVFLYTILFIASAFDNDKKSMVGYEVIVNSQRDKATEFSAERLHNYSEIHYKHRK